jgi:hypothetical protein
MGQSKRRIRNYGLAEAESTRQDARQQRKTPGCPPLLAPLSSRNLWSSLLLVVIIGIACARVFADTGIDNYEGRVITSIEIVFEGSPPDATAQSDFLSLLKVVPNTEFSAVRVRDSLQTLFDSGRVANARV